MQSVDEIMFERTNLPKKNELEGKKPDNPLVRPRPAPPQSLRGGRAPDLVCTDSMPAWRCSRVVQRCCVARTCRRHRCVRRGANHADTHVRRCRARCR